MKKSILFITTYLSVLLMIFGCAQIKMADYQPKSAGEKEVLGNLIAYDKALKNRNLEEAMACIHDNATIKLPSADRRAPVVSKRQFGEYLEAGNWAETSVILVNPSITTRGDKATLKCSSAATNVIVKHTFNLIKENEKWSIMKIDYTW